jgi:serine protease Do
VIKVNAQSLIKANIGDSSKVRVGEWVLAVGNPLGLGISAKEGIVGRVDVMLPVSSEQTLDNLIETSAAINPGNSGGPLVNMRGEVIGITSIKIAVVGVEGLGYAISSKTAVPIIEELVQKGYVVRPWLGIVVRDVDQWLILTERLTADEGAFVTQIGQGSPAANAGIKQGDVIISLGGKEITTSQQLIEAIHTQQIGTQIEIIFWRGNAKKTAYATLTKSPPPP